MSFEKSIQDISESFKNHNTYKENYDYLMSLPIVKQLKKENKKLAEENKKLILFIIKNILKNDEPLDLEECFRENEDEYEDEDINCHQNVEVEIIPELQKKQKKRESLRKPKQVSQEKIQIKKNNKLQKEKEIIIKEENKMCEIKDESKKSSVDILKNFFVIPQENNNVNIINLIEEEEINISNIKTKENNIDTEKEKNKNECFVEEDDKNANNDDSEEDDKNANNDDSEEDDKNANNDDSEEDDKNANNDDSAEEVNEIYFEGIKYYITNEKNGIVYGVDENDDPGDEVGQIINGEIKLF